MPRRLARVLVVPVLAGPAVLAFFSGGYFDEPRLWAGVAAWILVAALAVAGALPRPPQWLALAGLTAWTGLSILWAPLASAATDDFQRLLLYLGAFVAALAVLEHDPPARRAAEPVLLAGCVVVGLYAVSERLLPGLVSLEHVASAGDRLNQPLTYWNGLGALMAMGLVLAAGLAAQPARPVAVRMAAAAAAAPLGLALFLTFSRGALAAAGTGLAVLLAMVPSGHTVRAVAVVAAAAAVPIVATAALPGVATPTPAAGEGLAMIGALAAAMGAAAVAARALPAPAPPARLRAAAVAALAIGLVVSVVAAVRAERRPALAPQPATAQRLVSARTNRYEYWKVAVRAWTRHPLAGTGAGGFAVEWLRERPIAESVRDAHSLYLETAAELGLVGVALLGALVAGAVRSARAAGPAGAGAASALATFALHAALDWDWEMPAVSLVALVLLARLAAGARLSAPAGGARARRRPSRRRAT